METSTENYGNQAAQNLFYLVANQLYILNI